MTVQSIGLNVDIDVPNAESDIAEASTAVVRETIQWCHLGTKAATKHTKVPQIWLK